MAARTRAPLGLFCLLALVLSLSPAAASRSLLDAAAAAAAAAATASQQASIAAAAASGQYTPSQASQAAAASAAAGAAQQQTIASGYTPVSPAPVSPATPAAQAPGSATPSTIPTSVPAQECKRTLIWTPADYGNALLAPVLQDASLFGVQGCAASGLVPRCCNGPEADTITYPYGFSCISDTSGSAYGGQCPQQTPDYNHFFASACCPQ